MKCKVSVLIKNEYLAGSVCLIARELGFDAEVSGERCNGINIVDSSLFFKSEEDCERLIYVCENRGRIPKGVRHFLSKPFLNSELKILLLEIYSQMLPKEGTEVIFTDGELVYNNLRLRLTQKEAQLFACLYENREAPVSRERLLRLVWDGKASSEANVIDVYVSYIRKKTRDSFGIDFIKAVRGVGYMYTEKYTIVK